MSSTTASIGELKPPQSDLQLLCSSNSLAGKWGEYRKCLSACLPSRCCLVPEDKSYLVRTAPGGGAGVGAAHKTVTPAGTVVHLCSHAGACLRYKDCSALGTPVLLLRKEEPSNEDPSDISDGERLELAERIHRSCPSSSRGDDNRGKCGLLYREKACYFAHQLTHLS